jgi:hypothetical protein
MELSFVDLVFIIQNIFNSGAECLFVGLLV